MNIIGKAAPQKNILVPYGPERLVVWKSRAGTTVVL